MFIFRHSLKKIFRTISKIDLKIVLMLSASHFLISYFLLSLAKEKCTENIFEFFYFWVVTSSTVGYGDILPETIHGKMIVATFFIPFSLAMFALLLAKLGELIAKHLRRDILGMNNFYDMTNHILIMGYNKERTHEQVRLILSDKKRKNRTILVVTAKDIEHPFLDVNNVDFCKVTSLIDDESLKRVSLNTADKIIVEGNDDNESYVLSSHYATCNKNAHITTHIKSSVISGNLQSQHNNIEVVEDNTDNMIVRTMQDSGTCRVVSLLLKAESGPTFYTNHISPSKIVKVSDIAGLINNLGGVFIGYSKDPLAKSLVMIPNLDVEILVGEDIYIHYISESRIDEDKLVF